MSDAWEVVLGYFADNDVPVDEVETESTADHALRVAGRGRHGDWVLWVFLDAAETDPRLSLWCTWPVPIPVEAAPDVAQWIGLANPRMSVGSFEMDSDDDIVSLRRTTDLVGGEVAPATIEAMVSWALETFDDALATLSSIVAG